MYFPHVKKAVFVPYDQVDSLDLFNECEWILYTEPPAQKLVGFFECRQPRGRDAQGKVVYDESVTPKICFKLQSTV